VRRAYRNLDGMYPMTQAYDPYTGTVGQVPAEVPASQTLTAEQLTALCEKGKELGKVYAAGGYEAAYKKAQEWTAEAPQVSGLVREPKAMDYLASCMLEGYYQERKSKDVGYKQYAIGGAVGVVLGLLGGYALSKV